VRLTQLVAKVSEGDPSNIEATAARIYWAALFGEDFRRHSADRRSTALEFGYAVLRGIVCRSIVAAGLHPDLGVCHRSDSNGFNLADDLIEPFRPAVDMAVWNFARDAPDFVMVQIKSKLGAIGEVRTRIGLTAIRCRAAVAATTASFVRIVDGGTGHLTLPDDFSNDDGPDA
jgi:CRISPR-associated protein Cas1